MENDILKFLNGCHYDFKYKICVSLEWQFAANFHGINLILFGKGRDIF